MIKPTVELRSTWSSHMLNVYARGNIGFYTGAPTQNYQDVAVGTDGRIDIQRNWNIYGGFSFNRKHEDPGLPNTVSGPSNVTIYNQLIGSAGYYQKVNRFSARAEFNVDNYTYFDNGLGIAQGVGQALTEKTVYDDDSGQLISGSFMDYALPRADDLPSFDLGFNGVPCTTNPLGVKGCGEAGAIAAFPAIANAILDALAPLGVRNFEGPATPARIWQAIEAVK